MWTLDSCAAIHNRFQKLWKLPFLSVSCYMEDWHEERLPCWICSASWWSWFTSSNMLPVLNHTLSTYCQVRSGVTPFSLGVVTDRLWRQRTIVAKILTMVVVRKTILTIAGMRQLGVEVGEVLRQLLILCRNFSEILLSSNIYGNFFSSYQFTYMLLFRHESTRQKVKFPCYGHSIHFPSLLLQIFLGFLSILL